MLKNNVTGSIFDHFNKQQSRILGIVNVFLFFFLLMQSFSHSAFLFPLPPSNQYVMSTFFYFNNSTHHKKPIESPAIRIESSYLKRHTEEY